MLASRLNGSIWWFEVWHCMQRLWRLYTFKAMINLWWGRAPAQGCLRSTREQPAFNLALLKIRRYCLAAAAPVDPFSAITSEASCCRLILWAARRQTTGFSRFKQRRGHCTALVINSADRHCVNARTGSRWCQSRLCRTSLITRGSFVCLCFRRRWRKWLKWGKLFSPTLNCRGETKTIWNKYIWWKSLLLQSHLGWILAVKHSIMFSLKGFYKINLFVFTFESTSLSHLS